MNSITESPCMHATIFLLIFAGLLVAYGIAMHRTGDINLMPYRVQHSVHSQQDVRRVGLIVMRVGIVLAAVLCIALLVLRLRA